MDDPDQSFAEREAEDMDRAEAEREAERDDALTDEIERVRVAAIAGRPHVSIDGDNWCGPFKTTEAARAYGAAFIAGRPDRRSDDVRNLLARRFAVQQDRRFSERPVAPTGFGSFA